MRSIVRREPRQRLRSNRESAAFRRSRNRQVWQRRPCAARALVQSSRDRSGRESLRRGFGSCVS
jgi:hypothetical protein